VSIGLEQQVAGPETQVDYAGDREGGPRVAVAATEPWFLIGRLDGREFRVVRADRLAAIIGPDYREWWLYSDEAFDSKLSAALARAHRENRGKTMTEVEAVAFVEAKRRSRALRRAKPYLESHS